MIEAVLFDLDGTLLHNDMDRFLRHYLRSLSSHLSEFMPAGEFVQHLLIATKGAVANMDPETTNEVAFRTVFDRLSPCPLEEMEPTINDFYTNHIGKLVEYTRRRPEARAVVETALHMSRPVVVATNPVFPLTAVEQRMEWAGIADLPFALITSYENMHFTKPHKEYYQEIADMIGVSPDRCLMVGDDLELDKPATEVGMQFFRFTEEQPFSESEGSLEHLHSLIRNGLLDS